ncbi:actin-binding protein IPP isoform X1 [Entelurus aequoreus]|uniref:actin-binding protein IPP isoform X1 n=1 Tax=Entelurus aequoreus TaxID=161455 RepID=UPI002B1D2F13|nr:actin-binding protein IPP isoform X1 [Entelurus aequoreus]
MSSTTDAAAAMATLALEQATDRHARLILARMNKMRLSADFCDVRLRVGGRVFKVHRLVLAAASPYFSALFSLGMSEAAKEEVEILGVDGDAFEVLLGFVYTGAINVTVDNVQELMLAADMLQLNEIVSICGDFLKGQMDSSNCVGMFQFLEQIACVTMLEFSENYIHGHFLEVCIGDEFKGLAKDQIVKLLKSEELRIEDEYQVFTAAMDWLLHDVGKRKKYVVEVLEPVRFPLLSPQRLLKYIEDIADFSLRVALQTLLKEYIEVTKSPKDHKMNNQLQQVKMRPRRKARKYLYAIGGYIRLQGGRWNDNRALSCVERFDTFNQYWTTVSSLHQARSGLGLAVMEGMIYVVGGEKDSMIFDCTERYDPVTKQWAAVASLNFPRCGVGVCPCNGALYAFGGWIGSEIGKTMERYDPEDNKWEVIGYMMSPRYYFGCCELQGAASHTPPPHVSLAVSPTVSWPPSRSHLRGRGNQRGKQGAALHRDLRSHQPPVERLACHGHTPGLRGRGLPQQLHLRSGRLEPVPGGFGDRGEVLSRGGEVVPGGPDVQPTRRCVRVGSERAALRRRRKSGQQGLLRPGDCGLCGDLRPSPGHLDGGGQHDHQSL